MDSQTQDAPDLATADAGVSALDLAPSIVDATLVSLGDPSEVRLPDGERGELAAAESRGRKVGDVLRVYVDRLDAPRRGSDKPGALWVSAGMAERLDLWERLLAAARANQPVDAEVVGPTKGGLIVDIGVRGFLPASQVELRHTHDMTPYVGQRFPVHVLEVDEKRGRFVVTRRPSLEVARVAEREKTLAQLSVGEIREGVVARFAPFGMFVDLGGVDGLAHVSEISWTRDARPESLHRVGDKVRVKILEIENRDRPDQVKIALGIKQLLEDPWAKAADRFPAGTKVHGKVVRLADFGVFVEVAPGIEGLVHVSELAWSRRPKHPTAYIQPGGMLDAVVLNVDVGNRRMSLSHKQTLENPWVAFAAAHPRGSRLRGTVVSIADFGIFLRPESTTEIEGLVHASDLTWAGKGETAGFERGQVLETVVLECDAGSERLGLGIKQLTDDPLAVLEDKVNKGARVKGKVTRLADFGAFIEIIAEGVPPGIEGLCHVSALRDERTEHVDDVVKVGQEVEPYVLDVDRKKRRVALSLREIATADYKEYLGAVDNPVGGALSAALKKHLDKGNG